MLKNKIDIICWLENNCIKEYKLIPNEEYGYVVDVYSKVSLYDCNKINVKFNEVFNDFNCGHNNLNSLEGCPNIVNGNFYCSFNKLKNLNNGPLHVYKNYYCNNNELETLLGCPETVKNILYCNANNLQKNGLSFLRDKSIHLVKLIKNPLLNELQNVENVNELNKLMKNHMNDNMDFLIDRYKKLMLN